VPVQNRYSFADREWDYVVDYCERNGIVFIPWFPLACIADAYIGKHMYPQVIEEYKWSSSFQKTQAALGLNPR
jgi:aryl-alcohol dehydrogenase-like predicted oxidoreductase